MPKRDATLKSNGRKRRASLLSFYANPEASLLLACELAVERKRKPFGALARVLNACIIGHLGKES